VFAYLLEIARQHSIDNDVTCLLVYSWEGSGVNEVGKDKATGVVRIRINPKYYRPTEVVRVSVTYYINLLSVPLVCHSVWHCFR